MWSIMTRISTYYDSTQKAWRQFSLRARPRKTFRNKRSVR
jgi:hypothetical protein